VLNAGSQTTLMRCEKEVNDYVRDELKPSEAEIDGDARPPDWGVFVLGSEKGASVNLSPDAALKLKG
jgi:hypothetical protein